MKHLKNAKDVLVLVKDMESLKASFDTKNEPKDLNESEAKSEVKKAILDTIVRQYIDREARLVSNTNNIYGIIWGQCTTGLPSVSEGNEDFPSKLKKRLAMAHAGDQEDHYRT